MLVLRRVAQREPLDQTQFCLLLHLQEVVAAALGQMLMEQLVDRVEEPHGMETPELLDQERLTKVMVVEVQILPKSLLEEEVVLAGQDKQASHLMVETEAQALRLRLQAHQ